MDKNLQSGLLETIMELDGVLV